MINETIKIEKNIDMPEQSGLYVLKETMKKMEVKESILIPCTGDTIGSCRAAVFNRARNMDGKFTTKIIREGDKITGLRVWRSK